MNTIKECFDTILRGNKEKSRLAARGVRKLVYSSSASGREKYGEIAALVRTASENYLRISEDWRQENFVMAVSVIYFLHDRENQPDFLFPARLKRRNTTRHQERFCQRKGMQGSGQGAHRIVSSG